MHYVSESVARELVTIGDAIRVVREVLVALDRGQAQIFPVVMAHGLDPRQRFGVKSGLLRSDQQPLVGLKVGSYWPGNRALGLPAHGSTTLLLDPATGLPRALVAASHLTALRTAAADGVAIAALARPDAARLALVGAGHQAWYELLAAREVRPLREVRVWSRTPAAAEALARRAREQLGLDARAATLESAVAEADIVATATAAQAALFPAHWVRPGTHVSAMGADARGKQELDVELVANARLFADVVEQSLSLGEFEAAHLAGRLVPERVTPLGAALTGRAPGRERADEITVFDSSGTALQDLGMAALALRLARASGRAQALPS